MVKIENEKLTVLINKFGAELKSVINKENGIEYIWPGTEGSFKKSAPNLFPFIGNILSRRKRFRRHHTSYIYS